MSWTLINDAILAVLSGVAGIDKSHKFRRLVTDDTSFHALYATNNVVNGWEISRTNFEDVRENQRVAGGARSRVTHTFTIYGYYGIKDANATELTFQQLIDDISEAFRGDVGLGGTAYWSEGPSALLIERREFYGAVVHYAELNLAVTEYVDP